MAYNFQTFGDTVDEAYRELSVDSASVSVPGLEQSEMEKWANRFSQLFIDKCYLKTQDDTSTFRTVSDTSLSVAVVSGAVTLTTAETQSALSAPASGMILLDGIPYTYSAFSGSTMTVEAVDRAYDAGDRIQFGYAVPTTFGKPRGLFIGGTRYGIQKWGTYETIQPTKYSVFGDYIFLPVAVTSARDSTLHFYKKATNTLTSASTMEIYQMWDSYVIYKLTSRGHRLLYDTGKAQEYDQLAKEVLNSARSHVAREDLSVHRGFVPGW